MAETPIPQVEFPSEDSEAAIDRWAVNIPPPLKRDPPLTRPNPAGNWRHDAIWGIYPSGVVIPRIYPMNRHSGDARLYRIEIHEQNDLPVFFITDVFRANSAMDLLGRKTYRDVELMLEEDWRAWEIVESDVDPVIDSAALGASGYRGHAENHVRYDLDVSGGGNVQLLQKKDVRGWRFWRMDLATSYRRERHAHAKRIRKEGVQTIDSPRRVHDGCRACARIRES
jgi:hypothetical protein